MDTVQKIELAISKLPPEQLASLRKWFDEFDVKIWDKQFEADVKSGKLGEFAAQAISDFDTNIGAHAEYDKLIK